PAAQLADLVQVEQGPRPRSVEVELDHHVRTALNRDRAGVLGLEPQRLGERARGQHLHFGEGYSPRSRAGIVAWDGGPGATAGGRTRRRAGGPRRPWRPRTLGLHARM